MTLSSPPLDGLRVVEIGGGVPAAFCSRLLRGHGADTVRVERVVDESGRDLSSSVAPPTGDQEVFCVAGTRRLDRLDRADLGDLVASADVVVDDRGPRFWAEVGIDPAGLITARPDLVITSISPFGATGPRRHWITTNAVQFAVGGLMSLTGDPHRPPLVTGGEQALFLGGLHAAAATTVALLGRHRTGHGAWIDLSMQEGAASMPELYGAMSEYETGEPVVRSGNSVRAVWGVYRCADGFAGVCCLERQVPALFSIIGEPVVDDPRFADPLTRAEHDDELLAHVMGYVSEHSKDELVALSPRHRVPFGAVRTPAELLCDPGLAERGFFDEVVTPHGTATMPGRPFPSLGWKAPTRLEEPSPGPVAWTAPGWRSTGPAAGDRSAPLHGVRIVDLSMMWAGPYATKLLAEAGAEVIKIESPRAWDNIRTLIPQDPSIPDPWNSSYYFNEYNHSKKSLTLDLTTDAGREVLLSLVATADVVIENYRADVLDNLGLGDEVLRAANPSVVLVSMAGFGKTGPLRDNVGFGPIIEMMSGLMSLTGYGDDDVPIKTGVSYGDPVGGLHAVAAIALALVARDRTGSVGHIDLAQRETAASMAGPAFVATSLRADDPVHGGNRDDRFVPQGCYRAAGDDQWVVVSVGSDAQWAAVCALVDRPDLASLDAADRLARHDELDASIEAWTTGRSATEAAEALQARGVPAGEVWDTLAIHDCPQLTDRGFWRMLDHPKMRPYRQTGPTWRIVGPPLPEQRRAPFFGEHNAELLTELGRSTADVARLAADEVVADAPVDPGVG